jgi:uncharacterized membrane protein
MNWKYIIVLIVVLSILVSFGYIREQQHERDKYIEHKGIKILKEDYEKAKELNKDNLAFEVCNIKTKKCITFFNIENIKKFNEFVESGGAR